MGAFVILSAVSHASIVRAENVQLHFSDPLTQFDPRFWEIAEYTFSHPHFDTDWSKANAVFGENNGLALIIHPQKQTRPDGNKFLGASIRRKTKTQYGRYESWIKPAKGEGFVTGFFTYTGESYGTRHDEIDIEFLGGNTNQIHIAWFVDGKLTNKFIELPYDAAEKPYHYAFEWFPNRISWLANGTVIFSIQGDEHSLPKLPSLLFANVWAADHSIANWSGKTKEGQASSAWFSDIAFTPAHQLIDANKLGEVTMTASTGSVAPAFSE